jgi:hypothetical protein
VIIHKSGMLLLHQRYNHNTLSLEAESNLGKAQIFSGIFLAFVKILRTMWELGFPFTLEQSQNIQIRIGENACCSIIIDDLYIMIAFTQTTILTSDFDSLISDTLVHIKQEFDRQYRPILEQWNNDLSRFHDFKVTLNEILKEFI